jgi:hypothetical protein
MQTPFRCETAPTLHRGRNMSFAPSHRAGGALRGKYFVLKSDTYISPAPLLQPSYWGTSGGTGGDLERVEAERSQTHNDTRWPTCDLPRIEFTIPRFLSIASNVICCHRIWSWSYHHGYLVPSVPPRGWCYPVLATGNGARCKAVKVRTYPASCPDDSSHPCCC